MDVDVVSLRCGLRRNIGRGGSWSRIMKMVIEKEKKKKKKKKQKQRKTRLLMVMIWEQTILHQNRQITKLYKRTRNPKIHHPHHRLAYLPRYRFQSTVYSSPIHHRHCPPLALLRQMEVAIPHYRLSARSHSHPNNHNCSPGCLNS
jgi:hypothetical protein